MKKLLTICLAGMLLLGCAPRQTTTETYAPTAAPTAAPAADATPLPVDDGPDPQEEGGMTVTIDGETFAYDGYRIIEPEVTFDIHTKTADDFVDDFNAVYEVARESYRLTPGTDTETTVVKITGAAPGPAVYVAAGIHGDERAAWYAGLMLQNITIKAGTLYVLAPANAWGAQRNRRLVGEEDPNRCFPGNESGTLAGSTLIYTSLEGMEDLFFDLLFATQEGEVTSCPFGYNGPGPAGSMNRTVADQLKIPAITVETFRGYPMERRVSDQLKVVAYALRHKGML